MKNKFFSFAMSAAMLALASTGVTASAAETTTTAEVTTTEEETTTEVTDFTINESDFSNVMDMLNSIETDENTDENNLSDFFGDEYYDTEIGRAHV